MANEYSSLKMVRHFIRDGGLPKAPKQVQLILSDLCNQDCNFCAYRMSGYSSNELFLGQSKPAAYGHNNPVRFIPTDRALCFLDEFKRAGVLAVQYTGGGEPTVHRDHEDVFYRGLELGLSSALVSNGLKWSDRLKREILPRFAWVRVSLDAGTAETYAKIRNTPTRNFEAVLDNVHTLTHNCRQFGTPCVIGVGYVVTPDNWQELDLGVKHAKQAGAAYIRLSAMFNPSGASPYESLYWPIRDAIDRARKQYATESFRVHDLFGDRLQDLVDGPPDYSPCAYQHYTTYVGGDMQAYRCCVLAYNKRGKVAGGDLSNQPFDTFWASEARVNDMAEFDARGCERCQFNGKNRAMAYLMEPTVTHEEFP